MLNELEGRGWIVVEPPTKRDDENVVARYEGEPVRSGFLMDVIEDSEDLFQARYRTGPFDLDVKVDFEVGRGMVRVEQAEGYE